MQTIEQDQAIRTKLQQLRPEQRTEVLDYIDFLLQRYGSSPIARARHFNFAWENALAEVTITNSVELQHQAMDWR